MIISIVSAFVFWEGFYFWPQIRDGQADYLDMLIQGGGLHLWYFPALMVSLFLTSVILRIGGLKGLAVSAVILYAAALCFGRYFGMLGFASVAWNTRNGPFFGLPFIAIGVLLGARDGRRRSEPLPLYSLRVSPASLGS